MRFVNSGTEATLMALRLSRIYTGKPKVLKFTGHFHGWHDFLIAAADPPYDPQSVPGLPADVPDTTVIIPPNDPADLEKTLAADPQIGCVIIEATGGHFGQVPVRGEFLRALRDITTKHNRLLIFDEVISGFRVHPGGAQGLYNIKPDLTTMAKILAGGLPGGCLAGRADIMDILDFRPGKPKMKHPGTFNANPLSAAAGITTLQDRRRRRPVPQGQRAGQEPAAKAQRHVRRPTASTGSPTATSRPGTSFPITRAPVPTTIRSFPTAARWRNWERRRMPSCSTLSGRRCCSTASICRGWAA